MQPNEIFNYVLVPIDKDEVSFSQFNLFLTELKEHASKHDFAQMVFIDKIVLKPFELQNKKYKALFIPFHKERFEDFTAFNWYLKTLSTKYKLQVFQLIMPDGSIMGM